ncbi:MAG: 2-oxo acid dehydrogenase subunit E2 [Alphaproteobacteria bacterium]
MAREFKLPDPGEGIHEAEILEILVGEGDEVEEGQDVLLVETDKASLELPAPESGVIEKIHVSAGDIATVGDVLITFADAGQSGKRRDTEKDEDGESDRAQESEPSTDEPTREEKKEGRRDEKNDEQLSEDRQPSDEEEEERPVSASGDDRDGDEPAEAEHDEQSERSETRQGSRQARSESRSRKDAEDEASEDSADRDGDADDDGEAADRKSGSGKRAPVKSVPATRQLARELGVDLRAVTPSGPHGRITDEDVRRAAEDESVSRRPSSALPDFAQWGETERKPLRSVRRAIANKMATAWEQIPHVTHIDAVAIDLLEAFRQRHRDDAAEGGGDLTLTAFVVKAVVAALKEHPRFNASIDSRRKEIVFKHYHNIGVAVDTDRGLLVPVLRDADGKSVLDIAAEISELAERARQGKLSKEDMSGGTFTITNVGPLGGRAFTPIINWPEAAILGLGEARYEPAAERSATGAIGFVPRLMLPLCLGFDHRVNDGADAARFMATFMETLADPDRFILAT